MIIESLEVSDQEISVGTISPLFYSRHARPEEANIMMFAMLSQGRFHQNRTIDNFEVAISGQIAQKPSVIQGGQPTLVVQAVAQVVPLPNFPEGYIENIRFRHIATVDVANPSDETVQRAIHQTVTETYDKLYDWLEGHGFTEPLEGFELYEAAPAVAIKEDGTLGEELTNAVKQNKASTQEAPKSPIVLA